jgi:hypothetical protein
MYGGERAFFAGDLDEELEELPERGGGGASVHRAASARIVTSARERGSRSAPRRMRSARFYARASEDAPRRHRAEATAA